MGPGLNIFKDALVLISSGSSFATFRLLFYGIEKYEPYTGRVKLSFKAINVELLPFADPGKVSKEVYYLSALGKKSDKLLQPICSER